MLILLSGMPKSIQGALGLLGGGHSAEPAFCQLREALREGLPGARVLLDL